MVWMWAGGVVGHGGVWSLVVCGWVGLVGCGEVWCGVVGVHPSVY